ncbi:hypothetical protein [Streptomyces sp. KLOTTS4A1]|uniref:hypothetical protein n=1 Tax=Streptomyces sp. KLOTTS4A1 TaxID=3390996 RepID=UPI0039F46CEA
MTDQQLPAPPAQPPAPPAQPPAPPAQPPAPLQPGIPAQQSGPAPWGGVTPVEPVGPAGWVQPPPPKPSLRDRRVLRAVARWSLAVLVCGGLGAGTAYGITAMDRGDVPGLATQADGRWEYPRLELPALPQGAPRPFSDANLGEIHHADLKDLILPAPEGARGDTGAEVVANQKFADLFAKYQRQTIAEGMREFGVREVVTRSWIAADGTETRIYLVRFPSVGYADAFADAHPAAGRRPALEEALETKYDKHWEPLDGSKTQLYVYASDDEHARYGFLASGDTLGLVIQSKRGGAEVIPFHQTLVLQTQLLN